MAVRTRNGAVRPARTPRLRTAQQASRLPPGIAAVLSVLSSSAVVVDSNDRVLRASSAARGFGLVKGDRLVVTELAALALPDLAVPSYLASEGGQFGDHEPVAFDQAEGPGRGAGPQHAVVAVDHDGRGGEHRQDGGDTGGQPGGLVRRPEPGVTHRAYGAIPGSHSHAISAVRVCGGCQGDRGVRPPVASTVQGRERGRLTASMVCGSP